MTHDWFRFYPEFLGDPKIGRLPEQAQLILVKCMCLEVKGYLDPSYVDEVDEDIAAALHVDFNDWIKARDLLIQRGLLKIGFRGYKTNYKGALATGSNRPPLFVWRELREIVFERDDYTCQYCGVTNARLECDHIIPVSRGGSNELSNLTTACKKCNQSKHNKTPDEWTRGEA